ncbi:ABC1 kinase family protein [Haliangium sp.]|uniref:ABC1 kinase family protein n=1 Tax=Haliangium sp. TaxID=2663208 RepID=UPI003D0D53BA
MFWYLLIGAVVAYLTLSALLPAWRRIWVFHLRALWCLLRWIGDRLGLRALRCRLFGQSYEPLTGPVLLRQFCEDMGPTFIKFGQIVASSAGIFPERYVIEFQKCLDRVRPFPFSEVERILVTELGDDKAAQFEGIDPVPLASASIAQVHGASLHDGTEIVLKVQRPGIAARIEVDIRIMRWAGRIAAWVIPDAELANPVAIIDDFAHTIREELDFRKEAHNLERFNEIMAELGQTRVRAPVPHWSYTTARVLVMERFHGVRVDDVETIQARDIDAEDALVTGLRAWFQCVVHYGFFHGDVHAGNLMLLDDDDIGFLDFGIVGRFDDRQRRLVTDYIIAFATGNYRKLAEVISAMGSVTTDLDLDAFAADLEATYAPLLTLAFGDIQYAKILPEIQRVASRHRMTMPREFVLITKQILFFDRYAKLLAPSLNVFTDPRLIVGLMSDVQKARSHLV